MPNIFNKAECLETLKRLEEQVRTAIQLVDTDGLVSRDATDELDLSAFRIGDFEIKDMRGSVWKTPVA